MLQAARNKYHNKPCTVDGHKFPSRREANRYGVLKLLERAGKIADLQLQVRYPLEVNGILIAYYIADFKYFDTEARRVVVEDCKGFQTDVFRLKLKLMRACYGIEIFLS